MNELIEFVWEHCKHPLIKEEFAEAIQTACKAQRNACIRRIRDEYLKNERIDLISTVLTAEITRQDYE